MPVVLIADVQELLMAATNVAFVRGEVAPHRPDLLLRQAAANRERSESKK